MLFLMTIVTNLPVTNRNTCRILALAALLLSSIMMVGCFGSGGGNAGGRKGLTGRASGNMAAYESSDMNAMDQAHPQIMVIPSDQVLQNFKCIKTETVQGHTYIILELDYATSRDKQVSLTSHNYNNAGEKNV